MIDALYFRLNPMIDDNVYLDEKDDSKLVDLMWEAHVYVYENRSLLEKIVKILMWSETRNRFYDFMQYQ